MLLAARTARSKALRRARARRAAGLAVAAAIAAPAAGLLTSAPASAAPVPTVTHLWLMNTDNGATVAPLDDYLTVLDLPYLPPHLSVQASLSGAASATFTTASGTHLENTAPYTMAGEVNGKSLPVAALSTPGTVAVDIAPWELKDGKGVKGPVQNRRIQLRKPTFTVNTTGDFPDAKPGDGVCASTMLYGCTVRAAVQEANALGGRQDIAVPAGTYPLTLGELVVTGDTGLWGHGRPKLVAGHYDRALHMQGAGNVHAEDLDLSGGDVDFGRGGVALVESGTLELAHSDVHGGTGNYGGGIDVETGATLRLSTSTVHDNVAGDPQLSHGGGATQRGGGISNTGTTYIDSSSITDNGATFGAGVTNRNSGFMSMDNSSIMGNTAVADGGGLENGPSATMYLLWSTVTDNKAGFGGYDLPMDYRGGGGIWNLGHLSWADSIVAQNDANWSSGPLFTPDCSSPAPYSMRSLGTNVLGVAGPGCGLSLPTSTTLAGTAKAPQDPHLQPRSNTPLAARVPTTSSLAYWFATSDPTCPSTDVRGEARTKPCWLGSAQG